MCGWVGPLLMFLWAQACSAVPRWLSGKEFTCNVGDVGSIPGLGRSREEGNGNPLWYSCLKNFMEKGASWATGHGIAKELNMT